MSIPKDPVDQAIAATEQPQMVAAVERSITVTATGRTIHLLYPVDITDQEMLALIGWVAQQMPGFREQDMAKARGGLVVPPSGLLLPS